MSKGPRNLRLLRIDDRLESQNLTYRPDEDFPPKTEERPKYIDWVSPGEIINIGSWQTATAFWMQFTPEMRVDLIVADVRFDDNTSPLSFGGGPNVLPTGLSHFKPFAAVARAFDAPIGLSVHTADWAGWKTKVEQEDDPVQRLMGRLAAHEIGELTAILKQGADFTVLDEDATLQFCWNWLKENRAQTFEEAFPKALSSYRKRLASVFVSPDEWSRLASWCESMRTAPKTIGGSAQTPTGGDDDPGFSFYLADGTSECVSLRSLFSDVLLRRKEKFAEFDFDSQPLPPHCFDLVKHDQFHELDEDGYPRVGALVQQCSRIANTYSRALELLSHFSLVDTRPSHTLADLEQQGNFGPHEIGYAILFKYLEQQHELYQAWERAFENYEWNQANDFFTDTIDAGTLKEHVRAVARVFSSRKTENLSSEDVQETLEGLQKRTITRCLNLLLSMGAIERRATNSYRYKSSYTGHIPPIPPDFSGEKLLAIGVPELLLLPPNKFLQVSFGYTDKNYNSIGGNLSRAFLGRLDRVAGRDFLQKFFAGEAPPQVKILCRQYATGTLGWVPQQSWPPALRRD